MCLQPECIRQPPLFFFFFVRSTSSGSGPFISHSPLSPYGMGYKQSPPLFNQKVKRLLFSGPLQHYGVPFFLLPPSFVLLANTTIFLLLPHCKPAVAHPGRLFFFFSLVCLRCVSKQGSLLSPSLSLHARRASVATRFLFPHPPPSDSLVTNHPCCCVPLDPQGMFNSTPSFPSPLRNKVRVFFPPS